MQKQSPLISVVMPLYNAEPFVGESIESVLRQTVGDFELIVIDDASTDASAEVARRYAEKDSRIVVLRNEANRGAAYSRNRGLDAARGEFIAFADADDLLIPERFAKQLAFFGEHPQIDLCGGYYTAFEERAQSRKRLIKVPLTHEEIVAYLLFGNSIGTPSIMMRSEAFKRSGVRFCDSLAEDYQFWIELSATMRMATIPESLFFYRRWENQISTSRLDRQTQSARIIQREQLLKTLGVRLLDEESRIFSHCSLRVMPLSREDLRVYRHMLKRIYKANAQRKAYDPKILRRQMAYFYKSACRLFYPSWRIKIDKRLLLLELILA